MPILSYWQYNQSKDLTDYIEIKRKWRFDFFDEHRALQRLNCSFVGSIGLNYCDIDTGEVIFYLSGEYDLAKAVLKFIREIGDMDWCILELVVNVSK